MIKEFCEPELVTDYKAILNVKRVFERNIEKVKYTQNRMFLFTKNGMYCISQIGNQYMTFISKKKLTTRKEMDIDIINDPLYEPIVDLNLSFENQSEETKSYFIKNMTLENWQEQLSEKETCLNGITRPTKNVYHINLYKVTKRYFYKTKKTDTDFLKGNYSNTITLELI